MLYHLHPCPLDRVWQALSLDRGQSRQGGDGGHHLHLGQSRPELLSNQAPIPLAAQHRPTVSGSPPGSERPYVQRWVQWSSTELASVLPSAKVARLPPWTIPSEKKEM